jgi:hypothetical protein
MLSSYPSGAPRGAHMLPFCDALPPGDGYLPCRAIVPLQAWAEPMGGLLPRSGSSSRTDVSERRALPVVVSAMKERQR